MSTPPEPEVLRAQRIELVDEEGRARLVAGRLHRHEGAEGAFGVAVLDAAGKVRVWLALERSGPALVFDLGGNNALHLGVDDPSGDPHDHTGAFVHLADHTGTPVLDVLVEADGSLTVERADPPGEPGQAGDGSSGSEPGESGDG